MAISSTADSTRRIIERFHAAHGSRYGYSEVLYYGKNVKVKVVCHEQGHGIFEQTPANHLLGQGCPSCKGHTARKTRAAKGPGEGKSFAELRPAWVYQWDSEHNGDLRPEHAYPTSGKVAWWHEPTCGHRWQQKITNRGAAAQQCPVCTGDIFQSGVNDLITLCPEVAREWHPTKNVPLTPAQLSISSGQRVWWTCKECRNEWATKVNSRTKGNRTGCPRCGQDLVWEKRGKPAHEKSVAGRAGPEVLAQWSARNTERPEDVYFGNTTLALWWIHPDCRHEWRQSAYNRAEAASGCPVCNGRIVVAGINDLATTDPQVAARWHPKLNGLVTPRDLRRFSNKKFWWRCPTCQAPYERTVTGMVTKGSVLCRDCARKAAGQKRAAPIPGHSFADEHPGISEEWHPTLNESLRSNQVRSGSNKSVWWLCSYGHSWQAQVSHRTSPRTKRTCPHCAPGSYGERAVIDVLQANEVKYERQWSDPTLKDRSRLRYDFMLPESRALIEFDGEQHRRSSRFGSQTHEEAAVALEDQKRRDQLKTNWARENHWALIRIETIPEISDALKAHNII